MSTPILRTSERATFGECVAKWNWRWNEGLVPRHVSLDARWFGTGVHLALANWYCGPGLKRGPHPAETWEKYVGDLVGYAKTSDATEEQHAQYVELGELGKVMLEGYIKKYGRDEHMHIIQPEQTFALDLPWSDRQKIYEFQKGSILCKYCGTYDLVWRNLITGQILLEEHKTAKTISLGHLPMDNQGGSYWAVATMTLRKMGLISPKEALAGIEYNYLRKGLPDDNRPRDAEGYATNKPTKKHYLEAFQKSAISQKQLEYWGIGPKSKLEDLERYARLAGLTVLGERSKVQPTPLFIRHMVHRTRAERVTQLRRIQDEATHIQAVRDGLLPITKTPGRHCQWCDYLGMCELQERGGNWQDYRRAMFKKEDPYADHRKSTDD